LNLNRARKLSMAKGFFRRKSATPAPKPQVPSAPKPQVPSPARPRGEYIVNLVPGAGLGVDLDVLSDGHVVITGVVPGSAAAAAGVPYGPTVCLFCVNARPVKSMADVKAEVTSAMSTPQRQLVMECGTVPDTDTSDNEEGGRFIVQDVAKSPFPSGPPVPARPQVFEQRRPSAASGVSTGSGGDEYMDGYNAGFMEGSLRQRCQRPGHSPVFYKDARRRPGHAGGIAVFHDRDEEEWQREGTSASMGSDSGIAVGRGHTISATQIQPPRRSRRASPRYPPPGELNETWAAADPRAVRSPKMWERQSSPGSLEGSFQGSGLRASFSSLQGSGLQGSGALKGVRQSPTGAPPTRNGRGIGPLARMFTPAALQKSQHTTHMI